MSTEHNKQVVLRWREERNNGKWTIIDELHASDYVGYIAGVPGPVRGREALKHLFAGYWAPSMSTRDLSLTSSSRRATGW